MLKMKRGVSIKTNYYKIDIFIIFHLVSTQCRDDGKLLYCSFFSCLET